LPVHSGAELPEPAVAAIDGVYNVAITGVGGTGVLTIGAIVGMAAHLEGKAALIQDFSGLAQKGGAVLSHVRFSNEPGAVASAQIPSGECDLLLAADTVVAAGKEGAAVSSPQRTRAVLNTHLSPVSGFIFNRDFDFQEAEIVATIARYVKGAPEKVDFGKIAEIVCGDAIATNIMIVGYACQMGLLPVGTASLLRAIELNGVSIDANKRAFDWGRRLAAHPAEVHALVAQAAGVAREPDTLEQLIERRAAFLADYQDAAWAKRYRDLVAKVEAAESKLGRRRDLTNAVVRNYFKLMSYKDEYEVARLYTSGDFEKQLRESFDGKLKLTFHLAPPFINSGTLPNGRPKKREFGPWMMRAFRMLAKMKGLRGTRFDVFARSPERRMERRLIAEYEQTIGEILAGLSERNHAQAVALASLPEEIRGFGPVKETAAARAEQRKPKLLSEFRNPPPPKPERRRKTAEAAE
jgi:indolepyruvate ferredoxin oxidoreductase